MGRLARYGPVVLTVVLLAVIGATHAGVLPVPVGEYDTQQLRVTDCEGTQLATVESRVADSSAKQYVGLGRTQQLGADEGMVFTGDEQRDRQIVMRGMSLGLDVVFVGADGRITAVVTLPAPDGVIERRLTYDGVSRPAQYVLEVPAGWANRTNVTAGDCVQNLP